MNRLVFACVSVTFSSFSAGAADMPVKAPPPSESAPVWTTTFATEFRYFTWQSSRGVPTGINREPGGGSEFYNPFALQLVGRPSENVKLEMLVRGGYVWARQSTNGLTGEVSTTTDTQLTTKATYYGINGIQPFASVSLNLPTGMSALYGSAANARMDSDLVGLAGFGEGFNVGPSVGFNLPITSSLILTMSGGYTWRGDYERENSMSATGLQLTRQVQTEASPGDVRTLTSVLGYKVDRWTSTLTGSVATETDTYENDRALFRAGTKYNAAVTVSYNWQDIGQTTLTGGYTHTNRNQVLFQGIPTLLTELMNTNSDVYRVGLQHLFPVGGLWVGPAGSYLHREHNGYDSDTLQYVPPKDRWSGGLVARYAASEKVTFNSRVEYVVTHEDDNPAPGGLKLSALNGYGASIALPVPAVSSTGWQFSGGVNAKF